LFYEGRPVHVSAAPVGVDTEYIDCLAKDPETAKSVEEVRDELGDAKLVLSVGRTDYTKGGVDQLESFERVLDENPGLRGKVRLMHVSVSANRNMTVYLDVQKEIEETAGRINGKYGTFGWQPITLISRAIPFQKLIAYYQAADVCWITPLADGMNLVCKEFVASRNDGDGVLVLSEFAGAAVEMHSAVITNPYSHRSMDSAIIQALEMDEDERKGRMKLLREIVEKYNIRAWGKEQARMFDLAETTLAEV
jgi:glucosylglycerol-phosphate synthase